MKRISFLTTQVFACLALMLTLAAGTATIEAAVTPRNGLDFFTISNLPLQPPLFSERANFAALGVRPVYVFDVEGLYAAVNDPQNAGRQVALAPGVYFLSVNEPGGVPRPNKGRLEL